MCVGSGGSVSRDNVRFLVIGKAVWEPPQAREWAPDYVSVCAGARVVRPGRPPGSSPGHGFPEVRFTKDDLRICGLYGGENPGCLEDGGSAAAGGGRASPVAV